MAQNRRLENAAGTIINPATQETLAAVLAKLAASPPSETTLAALLAASASTARASSGTTAGATNGDAAVELLAANPGADYHHLSVINEGAAAGFFSPDGGTNWCRMPAASAVTLDGVLIANVAVQVKRIAAGSNLSGVYGFAW